MRATRPPFGKPTIGADGGGENERRDGGKHDFRGPPSLPIFIFFFFFFSKTPTNVYSENISTRQKNKKKIKNGYYFLSPSDRYKLFMHSPDKSAG